jgi:hypothetical protein
MNDRSFTMPAVKEYKVTPLKFDQNLVDLVTRRRTDGESIATIAKALKLSAGKTAMLELIGTVEATAIDDAPKLARAVAKARREGKSWGWLAARFRVTEGTCRAAYTAATGQHWNSLDYRRKASDEAAKPVPSPIKRASVKTTRALVAQES